MMTFPSRPISTPEVWSRCRRESQGFRLGLGRERLASLVDRQARAALRQVPLPAGVVPLGAITADRFHTLPCPSSPVSCYSCSTFLLVLLSLGAVAADRLSVAGEAELGRRGAVAAVPHQDDGRAPLGGVERHHEGRVPASYGDDDRR